MKTKTILSIGLATAILIFTGCSSSKQPASAEIKKNTIKATNNLPEWIVNPNIKDKISAVGMTGYSRHGLQIMLPQAEMDGRARLAGQIQTIVSQLSKKAMRHVKINETDDFENSFNQATKEVVKKVPLSGVRRIKMFQAESGDLYVLMAIEKQAIANHLQDMKNIYKKRMQEDKLTRESLDDGMKVLDNMIEELDKEVNR